MTDDNPNEIVTVAYCPACEMLSFAGDLEQTGHPSEGTGHHLECPRCHARVSATDFYDYADVRVVDYE